MLLWLRRRYSQPLRRAVFDKEAGFYGAYKNVEDVMAEAVDWAQMQVAQALVAVKRRPEAASEEPTPEHATRNRVRKTSSKQLSLTALFQFGSEAASVAKRPR